MTTFYFFDTSALAKRYRYETGPDQVNQFLDDPDGVFLISELTIVELVSVLQRLQNRGEITPEATDNALAQFAADTLNLILVSGFRSGFIQQASQLVRQHGLGTLDALQLTAALELSALSPVFVCADQSLHNAARDEGLTVLDPLTAP